MNEFLQLEEEIIKALKTVFDPEIPANIWDLGMIYKIETGTEETGDAGMVKIDMTLTAPNCPAADFIIEDVKTKVSAVKGVKNVEVNLVFEPIWNYDMMSDEAKLELGML